MNLTNLVLLYNIHPPGYTGIVKSSCKHLRNNFSIFSNTFSHIALASPRITSQAFHMMWRLSFKLKAILYLNLNSQHTASSTSFFPFFLDSNSFRRKERYGFIEWLQYSLHYMQAECSNNSLLTCILNGMNLQQNRKKAASSIHLIAPGSTPPWFLFFFRSTLNRGTKNQVILSRERRIRKHKNFFNANSKHFMTTTQIVHPLTRSYSLRTGHHLSISL